MTYRFGFITEERQRKKGYLLVILFIPIVNLGNVWLYGSSTLMEWEKGCLVSVQQKSSICTKVMLGGRSPLRSPRVTSVYKVPIKKQKKKKKKAYRYMILCCKHNRYGRHGRGNYIICHFTTTTNIDSSLAGGFHQQKHFQRKIFLQKNKSKLSNYMRKGPRLKGS